MQDQRFCGPIPAKIPCVAVALFVIRTERDRILEGQQLKAVLAQSGQDALVQQHIIRVYCDPETGQVRRELVEDAVDPGTHSFRSPRTQTPSLSPLADAGPIRSMSTALRSGIAASVSSSAAIRA